MILKFILQKEGSLLKEIKVQIHLELIKGNAYQCSVCLASQFPVTASHQGKHCS